jgi:membrane glycosyltransferase
MQYKALLDLPGLRPTSRFQLVWAIMMFVGIPAFTLMIALAAVKPLDGEDLSLFPAGSAIGLYLTYLAMYVAPKLVGFLDVALRPGGLDRYGGGLRFAAGALVERGFSLLLGAATTLRTTLFMLGLLFGRSVIWGGQSRDAHELTWRTAFAGLWPQLLFGAWLYACALAFAPTLILWSAPLTLGYVAAIPFAVWTSRPEFFGFLEATGLCAIPEDLAPPPALTLLEGVSAPSTVASSQSVEAA